MDTGWMVLILNWMALPLPPPFPLCTPIYKPCHRLYIIDKRNVPCFVAGGLLKNEATSVQCTSCAL